MKIIDNAAEMRAWCREARRAGKSIGFVPTMGALHEGHLSLMRAAAQGNELAVASIFVNPTQFAPHEDFNQYPRTFDQDVAMCASVGVVAVYAPTARTMYTEDYSTFVTVGGVSEGLCGGSRPHFFRGVATVVTKLTPVTVAAAEAAAWVCVRAWAAAVDHHIKGEFKCPRNISA